MKNVKLIGWASILFLLVFASSCREEMIDTNNNINVPEPVVLIEASVHGLVVDENNDPVENAAIRVGTVETKTDENGFFFINDNNLNKNGSHLTVEKSGYYFGSKVINPTLGATSKTVIQLLTKQTVGSFSASSGGTVTTTDNASVSFGENGVMFEDGTAYTGTVDVAIKWLDPTHEQLDARMPGDLRAVNSDEERVQLATYGMVVVELQASNGAPLQVMTGEKATITLPVPTELMSSAPSTIPLWSFDEDTGYWVEESTASLQNGQYVGDVAHFSFWNCDAPFDVVEFEATVVDSDGQLLEGVRVGITLGNAYTRFAYTNSDGKVSGKIPKDEVLVFAIIDDCGVEIYSENIGPFDAAVVLPPISIPNLVQVTLEGRLVDCQGNAITNGYIKRDGQIYHDAIIPDENGVFSETFSHCGTTDVTLTGYDLDALLQSDPVTLNVPTGGGTLDFGDVEVCNVITEIISIDIPEFSYSYSFAFYNVQDNTNSNEGIYISSYIDSVDISFGLDLDALQTGTVDLTNFSFYDGNNPDMWDKYFYCQGAQGGGPCTTAEIVTNEGSGGILEGTFTGIMMIEGPGVLESEVTVDFSVLLP